MQTYSDCRRQKLAQISERARKIAQRVDANLTDVISVMDLSLSLDGLGELYNDLGRACDISKLAKIPGKCIDMAMKFADEVASDWLGLDPHPLTEDSEEEELDEYSHSQLREELAEYSEAQVLEDTTSELLSSQVDVLPIEPHGEFEDIDLTDDWEDDIDYELDLVSYNQPKKSSKKKLAAKIFISRFRHSKNSQLSEVIAHKAEASTDDSDWEIV